MASASQGLLATYKRYKQDTEIVAGWLVSQSTKHGFKFGDRTRCSINTSDFLPMAQFIATTFKTGAKGHFILNSAVDAAFRHAIVARKRVSAWYETKSHGEVDPESNMRHQYFTNILLKSWNILLDADTPSATGTKPSKPCLSSSKLPSGAPAKPAAAAAASFNAFTALTLEDVEDDGDDPVFQHVKSPSKTKKANKSLSISVPDVTIDGDEEQVEEEFWFAIQSFLMELHKVQHIVSGYWSDYKEGTQDLIMVALGTRTAIDLIRRAEIELSLQIVRPKRFPEDKYPVWKLPALLYARQHVTDGQDLDAFVDIDVDNYLTVPHGEKDFCLYNTYVVLSRHLQIKTRDLKASYESDCDPGGPGNAPNVAALNDMMHRLRLVVDVKDPTQPRNKPQLEPIPWEDEVSRGLRHVLDTGEVVIWAMFAFAVLLDINTIGSAHYAAVDLAEDIRNIIHASEYTMTDLEVIDDNLHSEGPVEENAVFGSTLRRADSWVNAGRLDYFISVNPLHCGLIKYAVYRSRQWGTFRENQAGVSDLWTMMHVYVAGRIAFPKSAAWPDMEFFMHQQGVEKLFVGGRPRTLHESAMRWLLAQGNGISELKHRDWDSLKWYQGHIDTKKWRPLIDNSVLGEFFEHRLHTCSKYCKVVHENFKEQIQEMYSAPALNRLAIQLNIDEDKRKKFVGKWVQRLHSWTLSEILELTQMYLSVDLIDVGFNWDGLSNRCTSMWEKVAPILRKGRTLRDTRRSPIIWTTTLLCDAAEAERCARKKRISQEEELKKQTPALTKLWELIQELTVDFDKKPFPGGPVDQYCYAAERSLVELLVMNGGETEYPRKLVVPHLQDWFKGWPAGGRKSGIANKIARQFLAWDHQPKEGTHEAYPPCGLYDGLDISSAALKTEGPKTTVPEVPAPETTAPKTTVPGTSPTETTPPKVDLPRVKTGDEHQDDFKALLKAAGSKFWA